MFRFTKKRLALVLAPIAVLAVAGAAFAYFSSTGTGSGSATVGTSNGFTISETGTSGATTLYPDASIGVTGGYVQTHSFSVTNAGKGSQNLATFKVSVANSNGSTWSSSLVDPTKTACTASDFSVGGQPVGTADEISSLEADYTGGQVKSSSVTIEMVDDHANQDNCQGVTVPLYYSAQ